MASFKNIFIKSKMNKDLDDRLLPQGEYRNAVNIQVSKSESEDVGALENVLGNEMVVDFGLVTGEANVICVGYLVSEVNSSIYFFLTDNTVESNPTGVYDENAKNFITRSIISPNTSIQNTILVQGAFLNFYENNPIHGVNLLEDLLFWTDNRNQPRKIRVSAAADDVTYYSMEDTISVAKYMPYKAPELWQEASAASTYETTMKDVVSEYLPNGTTANPYYNAGYQGDPDYLEDKFVRFSYRFKFDDGEYSVFAPFTQECFIPKQDGYFMYTSDDDNDMSAAYRSTIVDFMENKVNQIDLLIDLPINGNPNITTTLENATSQFKITEIEILYKESDGLAVMVADVIPASQITSQYDATVPSNTYKYRYSGTKPFRTLPEDQLIRVYDKVPVKALGQEIISNRIVYSNFQTKHTPPSMDYNVGAGPKRNFDITTNPNNETSWNTAIVEYPSSTLKQNRNYQAGFVLSDRFSRTTSTILSNTSNTTVASASVAQLSTVYSPYNPETLNIGQWPGDSLFIEVNEQIPPSIPSALYPGIYNGDPTSSEYNPLGFYTWKVVVKQQEQDYYNVYLPGAITAYPESATLEFGLTSHITLLNDNINKVPRDLSEVGPDQKQFRSSVRLFGRVENSNVTATGVTPYKFGVVNEQYYPSRSSDTVSTVSNMFDMFNIDPTGTIPNAYPEAFYEAESNPLIGRVSTSDRFGQIDPTTGGLTYSIQNLAVYETEPVESRLDIYWETSSSGTISDLNEQIESDGNQTISGLAGLDWYLSEYFGVYSGNPLQPDVTTTSTCSPSIANGQCGRFRAVATGQFQFEDSVTNPIQTIINPSLSVVDGAGVDISSDFELIQITGVLNGGLGSYIDYNGNATTAKDWDTFIIVNKAYRIYKTTNSDAQSFTLTITATDGDPNITNPTPWVRTLNTGSYGTILTDLSTIIVGGETFGDGATTWGQVGLPIVDYGKVCPSSLRVPIGLTNQLKLYGSNGSNSLSAGLNNQDGLQWNISSQTQDGNAINIFQISSIGEISEVTFGTGYGQYAITVTLSGPDGQTDSCSFELVVGEELADGSFSVENSLRLYTNYAYILSAHNSTTNAFDQITAGTGNSFTEMYPTPQSTLSSGDALVYVPVTGTGGDGDNSTCNQVQYGGQPFSYLERNKIPSGVNANLASPLTKGTAYISLQPYMDAVFGSTNNTPNFENNNDVSWAIEYRADSSSSWVAAKDIEGNVLSFNSEVSGYGSPTQISSNTGINATLPVPNPGGSPNPITSERNIVYGSSEGPGFTGNWANWIRVGAENNTSSGSFGGTFGRGKYGRWAVVGKSPYSSESDKFGEYRVIVQRIGGNQDNSQSCAAPIASNTNSQNNYAGAGAYIKTGDFYYDLGPKVAFGYKINPALKSSHFLAKNETTHNTVVYAREGIHRYVTTFYEDALLQTPYTGYTQVNTNTDVYLSYISIEDDGQDANGFPYTTPYNSGASSSSNAKLALAAEGASRDNATNTTSQNLRTWSCEMNPTTGLKVKGSAQPR